MIDNKLLESISKCREKYSLPEYAKYKAEVSKEITGLIRPEAKNFNVMKRMKK